MTPKQERFAEEYLIDLNASQAAIRAGYRGDPNTIGPRLLANVGVRSHIEALKAKRSERTQITQDRVLQEIARVAFFDVRKLYDDGGGMKAPNELDDDAAAALVGLDVTEEFGPPGDEGGREVVGRVKKAKIADKVAALTLAARHLGMLNDKLDVKATVTNLAAKMRERAQKA
jgi:phage terminase small subunit